MSETNKAMSVVMVCGTALCIASPFPVAGVCLVLAAFGVMLFA
jgi:hypothetical protein